MFQRKFIFCVCIIFIIFSFLYDSSFAMDNTFEDTVDGITIRMPTQPSQINEMKRKELLANKEEEALSRISSIVKDPRHSTRRKFDSLLERLGFSHDNSGNPDKSGVIVFYNYKNPNSKNWNEPYEFFKDLDEKFFLHPVSKKTRVLQTLGLGTGAAVPWAVGPLVMYLSQNILEGIPIAGNLSYGIIFTAIGCTTPPFAYYGWEVGGQIGDFLFDYNGFTPSKEGSKIPHIQKNERPIVSRLFSGLSAMARTTPFAILFLKAEMPANPNYGYGFIGPLSLTLLARTYGYSMKFWRHLNHSQENESSTMLKLKKDILIHSLLKTKTIINRKDEFVTSLYASLQKAISELRIEKNKRTTFHTKLSQAYEKIEEYYSNYPFIKNQQQKDNTFNDIIDGMTSSLFIIIFEYVSKEIASKECNIIDQEFMNELNQNTKPIIKKNIKDSKPFSNKKRNALIKDIDNFVHQKIRTIKLEFLCNDKKVLFSILQKSLKNFFTIKDKVLEEKGNPLFKQILMYIANEAKVIIDDSNKDRIKINIRKIIYDTFAKNLKDEIILAGSITPKPAETNRIINKLISEIYKININAQESSQNIFQIITDYIKSSPSSDPQKHQHILKIEQIIINTINDLKDPGKNNIICNKLYEYIQATLGKIKLDNDLYTSESDTSFSLFSLLLLKNEQLFDSEVQSIREDLAEATQDIDEAFSRASYDSATELLQMDQIDQIDQMEERRHPNVLADIALKKMTTAAQTITAFPIEKFSTLVATIEKLSPQSPAKRFLENLAIFFQGAASPGRTLVTYWAVNEILTRYIEGNPDITFFSALGAGLVDVVCRTVQEWDLQKRAFSSLRGFGSRVNDFWPLRWATNFISSVSSVFVTLPTIGILFNLCTDYPPYIKLLITIATYPSDYASFFHFFQEKWAGIIRDGSNLCMTCTKKTEQKRAWLNDQVDKAMNLIFELDETSIGEIYTNSQGGI